jgi:hypothetical protein
LTNRVTHSSSSNFTFEQPLFRKFEHAVHLLSIDRGKLVEKLINRFAVLETIEEVLNGDARAVKDRRAAHFSRIHFNKIMRVHAHNLSRRMKAPIE